MASNYFCTNYAYYVKNKLQFHNFKENPFMEKIPILFPSMAVDAKPSYAVDFCVAIPYLAMLVPVRFI